MPTYCVAYGCFNKGNIEGITYHRFPKNEELREEWISVVRRKDWRPTAASKLCSSHSREEDIDRTSLSCVRIRQGAVPTIFPAYSKKVRERRKLEREITSTSQSCFESPTKKLKLELSQTKSNLHSCKQKIKRLQKKNLRLTKRVANLTDIVESLKNNLNFKDEECNLLSSISKDSDCLIKRSIQQTNNPTLRKLYDDRLKAFAITLHFLSPKAYFYIRKTFNAALPHPRTLRSWYSSVNGEPGFSEEVLRALKEHSSKSAHRLICSLMLDCMAIRKRLEWYGTRFHGTVNAGNTDVVDDSTTLASEALVFLLAAINGSWKIPLGHFFVASINEEQLSGLVNQCLGLLQESEIEVASLTCDGAACNISMANKLGCTIDADNLVTCFKHPVTQGPIQFFLDPCHMLKLVRNTLADNKILLDADNKRIEWQLIEKLHNLQQAEGLHLGNKITNSHIHFSKQKMKVKLAAQVLSSSVADSLQYLLENKSKEFINSEATIKFLCIFNRLFDILNSRSIKAKYDKQAIYVTNFANQSKFLKEAQQYISKLKDKFGQSILSSRRKTGFIGFLVCIESTLTMYTQYVSGSNPALKYLPMYKVSQDHIERLFGYIRSRGGHNNNPSCKEFTGSFKHIILHRELQEPDTDNTLILNRSLILSVKNRKSEEHEINSSTPGWRCLQYEEQELLQLEGGPNVDEDIILNLLNETSIVSCDIVEYIAGYIVRSVSSRIVSERCLELLTSDVIEPRSLIQCKNRGGLFQPSRDVIKLCILCESVFKLFKNSGKLTSLKNLLDSLTLIVLNKCIGTSLFSGEHSFEQEIENNHIILLMKAICKKYLTVRLHHHIKTLNENLHFNKIRHHLTKTITFLGQ